MRLLVLSDLHTDTSPFQWPADVDFDVAVVAGDVRAPGRRAVAWLGHCAQACGRPLIFVPGNREYYGTVLEHENRAMRTCAAQAGLHLLDGDELRLGGVRFLGCTLWTDFHLGIRATEGNGTPEKLVTDGPRAMSIAASQLNEYRHIRCMPAPDQGPRPRRLQPEDTLARHWRERQWLLSKLAEPFEGSTVVITHHAPHRGSLSEQFSGSWMSAAFVSELPPGFFQETLLWIHGHTHSSFDYKVGGCRVISNPRGYQSSDGQSENTAFNDRLIVAI